MSEPRKHHFIPQCYLRNFSIQNKRKQVFLLDAERKIQCIASIKDVAQRRDFNRINLEGFEPNFLEKGFSKFENQVSCSLAMISGGGNFVGDVKDNILNLIALLAVRSPQRRNSFAKSYSHTARIIMDIVLTSKKRWDEHMTNFPIDRRVSYDKAKEFFESDRYEITTPRETHIRDELKMFEVILPYLFARKWQLVISKLPTHLFFTSDNPVMINWNEPEKIPPIFRSSPGFGRIDTTVAFPLTSSHFLIGRFDIAEDCYIEATDEIVATCNTKTVANTYGQIYASSLDAYLRTDASMKFYIRDLISNLGSQSV